MNLRHDTTGKPTTRSPLVAAPNQFETQTWMPKDGDRFTFFNDPGDLIADVSPDAADVDALIDLVETPTDEPPKETGGRSAPRNQNMIMDGRRRPFAVSNDTDED
jgi:hypothetical protein